MRCAFRDGRGEGKVIGVFRTKAEVCSGWADREVFVVTRPHLRGSRLSLRGLGECKGILRLGNTVEG